MFKLDNETRKSISSEDLEKYVEFLFVHFRQRGFPYFKFSLEKQFEELAAMDRYFKRKKVLVDGIINQSMHCLGTAWTYFPHSWGVRCKDLRTAFELYEDDLLLKAVIRKRLKRGTFMSDAGLRKGFQSQSGAQCVSNFRPSAARSIYDHFLKDEGVVWDMSGGFGGRLLGAISSPKVKRYIATDPSDLTYQGLLKLSKNLKPDTMDVEIHKMGSELFVPKSESLDLCFTSPPYFMNEKYSDDSGQSYLKYPDKRSWMYDFLGVTIDNCYKGLKRDAFLLINIANVVSYPKLVPDFLEMMLDKPFLLVDTLKIALSSVNKTGFKYEPVFLFKK